MTEHLVLLDNAAHVAQLTHYLASGDDSGADAYVHEQVDKTQLTQLLYMVTDMRIEHASRQLGFYRSQWVTDLGKISALILHEIQTRLSPSPDGPF